MAEDRRRRGEPDRTGAARISGGRPRIVILYSRLPHPFSSAYRFPRTRLGAMYSRTWSEDSCDKRRFRARWRHEVRSAPSSCPSSSWQAATTRSWVVPRSSGRAPPVEWATEIPSFRSGGILGHHLRRPGGVLRHRGPGEPSSSPELLLRLPLSGPDRKHPSTTSAGDGDRPWMNWTPGIHAPNARPWSRRSNQLMASGSGGCQLRRLRCEACFRWSRWWRSSWNPHPSHH